jgi:hypothetical protein
MTKRNRNTYKFVYIHIHTHAHIFLISHNNNITISSKEGQDNIKAFNDKEEEYIYVFIRTYICIHV